jgi:hypothetical protein
MAGINAFHAMAAKARRKGNAKRTAERFTSFSAVLGGSAPLCEVHSTRFHISCELSYRRTPGGSKVRGVKEVYNDMPVGRSAWNA